MTDQPEASHFQPRRKHFRLVGFLLGAGFVLIGFLAWLSLSGPLPAPTSVKGEKPPPPQAQPDNKAPTATSKTPAESTALLKNQLEQVLSEIREANQKKDLSQLLSHYSPNFPQLPQRAQNISKIWKIYDYPKMTFDIKEVRLLADNAALVRVTWDVEVQNISTLKNKNISKTYLIRFVKESGQWRIKALDKVE
jgi:hypothetical protein